MLEEQVLNKTQQNQQNKQQQATTNQSQNVPFYFKIIQLLIVVLALGIYVAVYYALLYSPGIYSFYYSTNLFTISNTTHINTPTNSPNNYNYSVAPTVSSSTSSTIINVQSIGYNWLFWKLANAILIYDMLTLLEVKKKIFCTLITIICLLAFDIPLFILELPYYIEVAYPIFACLVTLIISIIILRDKNTFMYRIKNSVVPYMTYIIIIAIYWFGMPQLYKALINQLSSPIGILPPSTSIPIDGYLAFFYIFPIIDTLVICLQMLMTSFVNDKVKQFMTQINFLIVGYRVGITLLVGYTQVEFYYLIGFYLLRNIFIYYVLKLEKQMFMTISVVGWIGAYYITYILQFVPITGLYNIIISNSYVSYQSNYVNTLLIGIPNSNYYINPSTPTYGTAIITPNLSLTGNIQWFAALIIWGAETFSQKYKTSRFDGKQFFYVMFGCYLFFLGYSSGLNITCLAQNQ